MKKTKEDKQWEELEKLAWKNARYVERLKDGWIVTADKFDGCDGHFSETVEEAIEWERRYI